MNIMKFHPIGKPDAIVRIRISQSPDSKINRRRSVRTMLSRGYVAANRGA